LTSAAYKLTSAPRIQPRQQADVDRCGQDQVGEPEGDRAAAEAAQPGEQGGGGQAEREDHQQPQAADLTGPEAGPVLAGDVPQLGHGVLASLGEAAGAPQQPGDPDG
jgi:hypothetical protein